MCQKLYIRKPTGNQRQCPSLCQLLLPENRCPYTDFLIRHIGAQLNLEESDPETLPYFAAFERSLARFGCVVGRKTT